MIKSKQESFHGVTYRSHLEKMVAKELMEHASSGVSSLSYEKESFTLIEGAPQLMIVGVGTGKKKNLRIEKHLRPCHYTPDFFFFIKKK